MTTPQNRRRFLQTSLAAGAVLTLGGAFSPRAGSTTPAARATGNPRVRPGRVRWHGDFGAACVAARTSDKPVLLFQMMGRLDEKFC